MPHRAPRRKVRPQQLAVLRDRDAVAADAVRRYCTELGCAIELQPWEKTHRGLHRRENTWAGLTQRPWMWGKVGQPFRLGDIADLKDAALGRVIFTNCRPEDIDAYERTITALQSGRSIVGA